MDTLCSSVKRSKPTHCYSFAFVATKAKFSNIIVLFFKEFCFANWQSKMQITRLIAFPAGKAIKQLLKHIYFKLKYFSRDKCQQK